MYDDQEIERPNFHEEFIAYESNEAEDFEVRDGIEPTGGHVVLHKILARFLNSNCIGQKIKQESHKKSSEPKNSCFQQATEYQQEKKQGA